MCYQAHRAAASAVRYSKISQFKNAFVKSVKLFYRIYVSTLKLPLDKTIRTEKLGHISSKDFRICFAIYANNYPLPLFQSYLKLDCYL